MSFGGFQRASFVSIDYVAQIPPAPESGVRPRDQDLPLDRKLCLMLDGRWHDAGEEPPLLPFPVIKALARAAWLMARLYRDCDMRSVAKGLGIRCVPAGVKGCYGEQLSGPFLLYKPTNPLAQFMILHGIAHFLLILWRVNHNEADVWLLTIALAVRAPELWRMGEEKYAKKYPVAPAWLVRKCAAILREHQLRYWLRRAAE